MRNDARVDGQTTERRGRLLRALMAPMIVAATGAAVTGAAPLSVFAPRPAAAAGSSLVAYVPNIGGQQVGNTVTPIALATHSAGTAITVGTYPTAVAITPDAKTAY